MDMGQLKEHLEKRATSRRDVLKRLGIGVIGLTTLPLSRAKSKQRRARVRTRPFCSSH